MLVVDDWGDRAGSGSRDRGVAGTQGVELLGMTFGSEARRAAARRRPAQARVVARRKAAQAVEERTAPERIQAGIADRLEALQEAVIGAPSRVRETVIDLREQAQDVIDVVRGRIGGG